MSDLTAAGWLGERPDRSELVLWLAVNAARGGAFLFQTLADLLDRGALSEAQEEAVRRCRVRALARADRRGFSSGSSTSLATSRSMMVSPHRQAPRYRTPGPSRTQVVIAAAFAAAIAMSGPAWADPLSAGEFGQLALRCGPSVAPSTLASIAQTESGFQPLSINDNTTGTSGVPATRDIAIQIASKLLEAGHSVDVGIMQINSGNFARLGLTLEAAFDPCRSVAAAAVILAGDYAGGDTHDGQQAALRVAISKYNTGDAQRGFANGYVRKVEGAARRVVPALDVGAAPAAIDSQPPPAAAPAVPVDPNAPPSWDVWASYDYAATGHHPAAAAPAAGPAVLADAGRGPPAAVTASGPPAVERKGTE